jgi:exonuclease SbcC
MAEPKERAELLETVTGTEIYSRLGVAAFKRASDVESQISVLQERLTATRVLDDDVRAALEAELVRSASAAAAAEVETHTIAHLIARAEATARADALDLEQREASRRAQLAQDDELQARRRRNHSAERLAQVTPAVVEYERAIRTRDAPQAKWIEAKARAQNAADVVRVAKARHQETTQAAGQARERAARSRETLRTLVAPLGLSLDDDVAARLLARRNALVALMEARDVALGAAVIATAADEECTRAAQALAVLDEQAATWEARARALLPATLALADFDDATATVATAVVQAAAAEVQRLQTAIDVRTELVGRLQETMALEAHRQALQAARAALVDGEPCPVCGSAAHPARHIDDDVHDDGGDGAGREKGAPDDALNRLVAREHETLRELHAARAGHEARIASVGARASQREGRAVLSLPESLAERQAMLARLDEAAPVVRRVHEAITTRATAGAALEAARAAHAAQLVVRDAAAARVEAATIDVDASDADVARGPTERLHSHVQTLKAQALEWGRTRQQVADDDAALAACARAEVDAERALERADADEKSAQAVADAHHEAVRVANDDVAAAAAALVALGAGDDVDAFVAELRAASVGAETVWQRAAAMAREADVARATSRERAQEHAERLARLGGSLRGDDGVDVASLPAALTSARLRVERCRDEAAAAKARLTHDELARVERQRLADELERVRADGEAWRSVSSVIGSADGNRFRQFAQGLTLDALVSHANEHLVVLAPRYRLRRTKSEHHRHDLDLVIIDAESGFDVRSTNTLSGGERFLVSLALALGLSSLSANEGARGRVESLFIDEGFSALDQETLDVALSAFDALRQTGRQIGVISHVPLLVERIGAQVRVVPIGGGASRVEIDAA